MSAILELPEVRAQVGLLSVEAYETLAEMGAVSERAELIRGIIVDKMPESPWHRTLVRRLFVLLLAFQRAGWIVFSEDPLRLKDSEPEPDAMIVRGDEHEFITKHPTSAELVVEVAVTSTALDRAKASLYAEANVSEYWIVLVEEQCIEVYRLPEAGIYQQKRLYSAGDMLVCESVAGVQIAPADLFAGTSE